MRYLGITYDVKNLDAWVDIDKITHIEKFTRYAYDGSGHISNWGVRIYVESGRYIEVSRTKMSTILPLVYNCQEGQKVLLRAGED